MHNLTDNIEEKQKGTMVNDAIELIEDASTSMTTLNKTESIEDDIKKRSYKEAREHRNLGAEAKFMAPTPGLEVVCFRLTDG